ncbi:hypothetical protein EK904_006523, partial [Melospiza melodia maxima]
MKSKGENPVCGQAEATPELSYREQLDFLNPIAQPLASRKLTRKLLKCIRKGPAAPAGRGRVMAVARCGAAPPDLGAAAGSKRPTCVILIKPHEEYQEAYDECLEE